MKGSTSLSVVSILMSFISSCCIISLMMCYFLSICFYDLFLGSYDYATTLLLSKYITMVMRSYKHHQGNRFLFERRHMQAKAWLIYNTLFTLNIPKIGLKAAKLVEFWTNSRYWSNPIRVQSKRSPKKEVQESASQGGTFP